MSIAKEIDEAVFEARQVALRDGREVLIRSSKPDDAAALLSYMHGCLPDISPFVGMDVDEFTHTEASEREWLSQQEETTGALVVLAFEGQRIVGITNCSCNASRKRIAHIGHIGMSADKPYWGSGLGSVMLGAMIDWAEGHPVLELLELDVYADNRRARSLYLGLGFVEIGEVPGRVCFADGSRKDSVLMYRRVDGTLSDKPGPNDIHEELGDGVVLRQLRYSDADQLFELYVRNREHLRPYFRWPLTVKSVGQVRGAIAELYELFASERRVNAAFVEDGKLLGLVFMNTNHDLENRRTELGYWLDEAAQGRGLMTAGCRALVRYAFERLEMNRIDITADVTNKRSLAVPERLGFTREAVLKQWLCFPDKRYVDMANYRLLREDWDPGLRM
jgi:ribosomal-protein-serine acetyltransferase